MRMSVAGSFYMHLLPANRTPDVLEEIQHGGGYEVRAATGTVFSSAFGQAADYACLYALSVSNHFSQPS